MCVCCLNCLFWDFKKTSPNPLLFKFSFFEGRGEGVTIFLASKSFDLEIYSKTDRDEGLLFAIYHGTGCSYQKLASSTFPPVTQSDTGVKETALALPWGVRDDASTLHLTPKKRAHLSLWIFHFTVSRAKLGGKLGGKKNPCQS